MTERVTLDDFGTIPSRAPMTRDERADTAQRLERGPWLLDAADLLAEPDPGPTPWLVQDLIVDRALVAGVGRWKTTKSYGMLEVCIAVATGRPAFGVLAIPNPGAVVFVNEESGRAALWRRLDALCRGRATERENLRERLFVAPNAGVKLDEGEWQAHLLEVGRRLQPRLFVFDPLARMKAPGRDESAQSEMAAVIEFLRRLRDETSAAVAFVHHTGHQGDHMRGSSDLETVWETRLQWKREGGPVVTVEAEHREAEAGPPFSYRIAWDGLTRSMRLEAVVDPFEMFVRDYLSEHPEASGNDVYKAAEERGDRPHKGVVHKLVKNVREGGSEDRNHPGTTPPPVSSRGGSVSTPLKGGGTTPADPLADVVPGDGTTLIAEAEIERLAEVSRQSQVAARTADRRGARPHFGDENFLPWLYAKLEAGVITEGEWHEADRAHRFVVAAEKAKAS